LITLLIATTNCGVSSFQNSAPGNEPAEETLSSEVNNNKTQDALPAYEIAATPLPPLSLETDDHDPLAAVSPCNDSQMIPEGDSSSAVQLDAAEVDEGNLDAKPQKTAPVEKDSQTTLDEALEFCDLSRTAWQNGELDQALEALDKAYSLILEIDTQKDAKLIQQKEDLRFLISKRILEIYASRNTVVNGSYDEIPLEMNRYIKRELRQFTSGGEKLFFQQAYQRSGLYRPYIVKALKKAGLPEELSWLPLIESGYKIKALSRARALGLWQFIPSTGYKFGLKRDRHIDERMDFIRATDAAIAYLKELHNIFGDWSTVLAAYNCGEGRVLNVIRSQNVNYLDNFWDLYERLPIETARYVPRFFAILHIVKNPEQYGLDQLVLEETLTFKEIDVDRELQLKDISISTGISIDDLKALNPELRYGILPPEPYQLRIPPKADEKELMAKLEAIPTTSLPQNAYTWHRVRSGETLSTIAHRYGTRVSKIMRANNMRSSNYIRAGQRLKIPRSGYIASNNKSFTKAAIPPSGIHYVRKGDSLWILAKRYGTTVKKITAANNLSSTNLYIGQPLKIPGYTLETLPDKKDLRPYNVKRGDSPYTIAQKHNMPLDRFLHINRLTPRSKIYPGQTLYLE
jgi:membrane-bound lytic murein transglycosylase D